MSPWLGTLKNFELEIFISAIALYYTVRYLLATNNSVRYLLPTIPTPIRLVCPRPPKTFLLAEDIKLVKKCISIMIVTEDI